MTFSAYRAVIKLLRSQFGDEWNQLTDAQCVMVTDDFIDAVLVDNIDTKEYARLIGYPNLLSYAKTLAAGKALRNKQ